MWIWCHPSIVADVKTVLLESFEQQERIESIPLFSVVDNVARFSLRGVKSQKILSELFIPDTNSAINNSQIFFANVLHHQGCNSIWSNDLVVNVNVHRLKNLKILKDSVSKNLKHELYSKQNIDTSNMPKSSSSMSEPKIRGTCIIYIYKFLVIKQ